MQNAALMAGPWLVGLGIDKGIPAVRGGHSGTLYVIVAGIVIAAAVQAVAYRTFVVGIGVVGPGDQVKRANGWVFGGRR